jgi:hypothetical protein
MENSQTEAFHGDRCPALSMSVADARTMNDAVGEIILNCCGIVSTRTREIAGKAIGRLHGLGYLAAART